MRIQLAMPVAEHEVWTQQAVDSLIGQTPVFEGEPATVVKAELKDGRPYITLEVAGSLGNIALDVSGSLGTASQHFSADTELWQLNEPRPSLLDSAELINNENEDN